MNRPIAFVRLLATSGVLTLALSSPAPVAAQTPPAGATPPGVNIGTVVFLGDSDGVDTARIAAVFEHSITNFRQCYVAGLATSPTVWGELQVDVTYGHNGRATAVTSTGLAAAPSVGPCVTQIVRPLHFPHPATRTTTSLRFLATLQFTRGAEPPPNG